MYKQNLKNALKQALKEEQHPPPEPSARPHGTQGKIIFFFIILCLVIALVITGVYFGTNRFSAALPKGPYGKILSTTAVSSDGRNISVIAETKNIQPGQYLWIAVDRPGTGLCWPKISRIAPNVQFKTRIYEGGPKGLFAISLYVVNKTLNNQWQDWLDRGIFGGLPIPPEKRRLDSRKLILQ